MVTEPRVDVRNEPRAMPTRRWWTRLSSAHILIFSAGALALLANLAMLRPDELPPTVAVAAVDLLPGSVFDASVHAGAVPLDASDNLLSTLVPSASVSGLDGTILTRRVAAGSLLTPDAFVAGDLASGLRLMSVAVDVDRAAGGALVVGDRVDVVAVDRGAARYVVTGTEIVDLPEERRSAFSAGGGYFVVLAVDADAVLELSSAMDTGTIQVVRSTGAPEPSRTRFVPVGER